MAKASTGNHFLAEMADGPEVDAVFESDATPKPSEGLPDGLENLLSAYQEFWEVTHHTGQALAPIDHVEDLSEQVELEVEPQKTLRVPRLRTRRSKRAVSKPRRITKTKVISSARPARQRFGLPEGFVPRMQRFGRGVLLELNIYRLPNGQELIPCPPAGTLGSRHLYALVTSEQYIS